MNKPKELQTTTQIIAREGFKPVGVCVALMLLFIFLHFEFLAIFALICAIFCAFIFRNTERIAQYRGNDAIIAPCDGIIKDISLSGSTTAILFKINIFDSGIFRVPAYITRIKSAFRFGLFIKSDKNLQSILNTKHKVSGFCGDSQIFTITLLPEAWNKANIYSVSNSSLESRNSSLGNHCVDLQNFGASQTASLVSAPKFRKNSTSTTANTIIDSNTDSANRTKIAESRNDKKDKSTESTANSTHSTIFIGDRLGFMKYGYLLLEIHAPCKLLAQRGDNLFAGESLIGKFQANLY
ncbi:hypothetical protein [Helicobacter sp. 23-1045]